MLNGMNNPIIFYTASVVLCVFLALFLISKNMVYTFLNSIVIFFITGFFFYLLRAEYNAVMQIAIYGIAVPIILGLAIMFTNTNFDKSSRKKKKNSKYLMIIYPAIIIVLLMLAIVIIRTFSSIPDTFQISDINTLNSYETISVITKNIYHNYIFAFEFLAVIIFVAVTGFVLLDNNKEKINWK